MAIITDIATQYGTVRGAYLRIVSYKGDKSNVSFSVSGYIDQTAREANSSTLLSADYNLAFPEGNLLTAAYEYLKVQIYPGAIDA